MIITNVESVCHECGTEIGTRDRAVVLLDLDGELHPVLAHSACVDEDGEGR